MGQVMTVISRIVSLLRNLFRKSQAENNLAQEVRSYFELVVQEGDRNRRKTRGSASFDHN